MPRDSKQLPCISVFSPNPAAWQWFAGDTTGRVRWLFHTEEPQSAVERLIRRPRMSRICGAFRCAREGKRERSAAFAAHSQFNTFWMSIALWLLSVDAPLLSFSFHFPELPTGSRLALMKWAFRRVKRFVVHSEAERERYSSHFGLPMDCFELIRWGVAPTSVEIQDQPPLVAGSYICAIGKDGRDYRTLIRAMERLPDLSLVIVAQPYNLDAMDIPKNVRLFFDIPVEEAMNILKNSQFMALPLEGADTSCGHITLVSAMFCRKAIVATRSFGIADYFPKNYESPQIAAGDVDGWRKALRVMAQDVDRRERCADTGEAFASSHCSHKAVFQSTLGLFREIGVDIR